MFDTVRIALDVDPEVQMSLLGSPARIANRTSVSRAPLQFLLAVTAQNPRR
jgi:hypothetical protein